jgi:acetyl esterase/lipase
MNATHSGGLTQPKPRLEPWELLADAPLPEAYDADGLTIRRGVVYASPRGFRPLELDVIAPLAAYRPGSEPLPAVIWIHGGAFALGSRRLLPPFLQEGDFFATVARAGFVVVPIDYRLSGEALWPGQLLDVRDAVRWVRRRAGEIGVRPDAICVWGESAGGHLALMAGVRGGLAIAGEASHDPADVAAVVDWYGPTDFSAMDRQAPPDAAMVHDLADSPESLLLGAPVQTVPELVADANPAAFVRPGLPPFLIRHGSRDRLVPTGQSELMVDALERAGCSVDWRSVDGADHVFAGHPDPDRLVAEAIDFLRRSTSAPIHSSREGARS